MSCSIGFWLKTIEPLTLCLTVRRRVIEQMQLRQQTQLRRDGSRIGGRSESPNAALPDVFVASSDRQRRRVDRGGLQRQQHRDEAADGQVGAVDVSKLRA
jgi:hypothetical protein